MVNLILFGTNKNNLKAATIWFNKSLTLSTPNIGEQSHYIIHNLTKSFQFYKKDFKCFDYKQFWCKVACLLLFWLNNIHAISY